MAIRIEHAPSAGTVALAGLVSGMGRGAERELETRRQAGQLAVQLDAQQTRQTQQLSAQRDMQMRDIDARADRQKEAADTAYARTALAAGLQDKIQEQQFDREMAKMQEAARMQANQFEYQFSVKDRQEIAKFNDARQRISRNPNFSLDEKAAAMRAIDLQQGGISPSLIPRDPNKPTYQKGRAPGEEFQDQGGNWHMVQPDGTTKMTLRRDQGPEAARELYEAEQKKAEIELRIKREDSRRSFIEKMMAQQVPVVEEPTEGGFLGYGAKEGGETGGTRFRTYQEAVGLADQVYGPGQQGRGTQPVTNEQLEQELQGRVDARKQRQISTPQEATSFIQRVERKYKGDVSGIPIDVLKMLGEAYAVRDGRR